MNVTCTSCDAKYVVPDEKVAGRRIRIRCRHCNAAIVINGTSIRPPASVPSSSRAPSSSKAVAAPGPSAAPEPAALGRMPQTAQPAPLAPDASDANARPATATPGTPRRRRVRSEFARTMVGGFAPAAGSAPEPPPAASSAPEQATVPAATAAAPASPEPRRESAEFSEEASRWVVALPEETLEDTSTEQVVQLFARGRSADDVLLWKEGMKQWQRPFDIPEIKLELLARGFTPPMARSQQVRRPEPQRAPERRVDAPLPSDWQSVFDRPSHAASPPALDRSTASRGHHPPSSVPPPSRSAAGSTLAEYRPAAVSLPRPLSTRPPSLRPVAAAASAGLTPSRPAPPPSRAPAASGRPPPPHPRRAGAVPLPAAARQRQSSELDIQIDVDAPRPTGAPKPWTRPEPLPAVRPLLVAPSLPEAGYPHPRRRRVFRHLLLALIVSGTLAAVVIRMTHRPTAVYSAMSLAFDRVKALLAR
jgi:predicted Zn finger-like uncharacterized protein